VVRDPSAYVERDIMWWSTGDPSGYGAVNSDAMDHVMLPYLPFFSNCDGYDSHVDISTLTENHPDCTYLPSSQTKAVKGILFEFQLFPKGDTCNDISFMPGYAGVSANPGLPLYCTYEENIFVSAASTRWFEAPPGTVLFHLTKNAISNKDFLGGDGEFWGRNPFTSSVIASDTDAVPVKVSSGGLLWKTTMVPRSVNLTVGYFQKSPTIKKIMRASITFGNYCTTSDNPSLISSMLSMGVPKCSPLDFSYTLLFYWTPLWWIDLLNCFAFDFPAYLLVYVGISLGIVAVGVFFYVFHYVTLRISVKPKFRLTSLASVILPAPVVGVLLSTVINILVFMILMFIWVISASANPVDNPGMFEGISGDWDILASTLSLENVNKFRLGRLSVAFLAFSIYSLVTVTALMTPEHLIEKIAKDDSALEGMGGVEEEPDEFDEALEANAAEKARTAAISGPSPSSGAGPLGVQGSSSELSTAGHRPEGYTDDEIFTPLRWKRGAMILVALFLAIASTAYLNFSFSYEYFAINANFLLPLFKALSVLFDSGIRGTLREAFLCVPYTVVFLAIHALSIQGSDMFFNYLINYLLVLATTSFLRLYIFPGIQRVVAYLPLWQLQFELWSRSGVQKTKIQRLSDEQRIRKIRERCEMETESMEPILGSYVFYSCEATALLIAPFFQLVLFLLDACPAFQPFQITGIPESYRINSSYLSYYTIFSLFLIPSCFMMDVFMANTLEVFQGWNFFDYVSYQRYRFSLRPTRWHLASNVVDSSISEPLQSVDMLCFSSQYYFLVASYAWAVIFLVIALFIQFHWSYNMFLDWITVVNLAMTFILCTLLKYLLFQIGYRGGLWSRKTLEGVIDDEIGVIMALAEGDAAALAVERIEQVALNSERFRKRFLNRAKPWIISQLQAILTPRCVTPHPTILLASNKHPTHTSTHCPNSFFA